MRTRAGRPRWTWLFMRSTACWSWDARATSASPEPGRGWGDCVHTPDRCTTRPRGAGPDLPGRRDGAVLRPVAEGGGLGPDADRGVPRRAFRSLVEPGGGEPGDGPGLPHRTEEECPGPQVRLPGHGRGKDRRLDRVEEGPLRGCSARLGRDRSDGDGGRRPAAV